eukprot:CAMPEP_0171442014 /NCGR_PEP_ID=MMETSP0881-20121228/26912_1 /TAXON_ID=67004 /ORGANISM="Thalassiosira weissflogii, Strain CCMP1336" /LENGTH=487 /DNA_ID=CAMNT_0011964959 /DNA_START=36 /DNA_END=1499 /DNA_ORIENTATION=-
MSTNNDDEKPPTDVDAGADGENEGNEEDHRHEDAAEILSNLLQNQAALNFNSPNMTAATNASNTNVSVGEAQNAAVQQLLEAMKGDVSQGVGSEKGAKHAFWDTQPMLDEKGAANEPNYHQPIVPNKPPSELRQEPYNMPKGFEWSEIDIHDPSQRDEVYDLLYQNYVEDDGCVFRFDYSRDFLMWALTPPGYQKQFHLGVRSSKSNRLMALITAVPATVRVYQAEKPMVEVNFLCVHKKLRSKRLAPVLIKEITRRVNHTGVFQAVYTAGVVLPGHVASCRYYHRTLEPRKLIDIGFTRLPPRMTMARMQKLYKLPTETATPGLRPMTPDDVPGAHALLSKYLQKFQLATVFTQEEFAHWMLPRKGVVSSFVAEKVDDVGTKTITDFCSFYHLHSSCVGNTKHPTLFAAYSFYNVATSVDLTELMRDCLILAKNEGHDVFNALNLMENERFMTDLKFGMGDGNLQYYVYNWLCPTMKEKDVGIVLL